MAPRLTGARDDGKLSLQVPLAPAAKDEPPGDGHVLAATVRGIEAACREALEGRAVTIRVGRYVSTEHQTEVGIYVAEGPRVGVFVTLRWAPGGKSVGVTVAPGSPLHGRLVWGAFVMGFVTSFAAVAVGAPRDRLATQGAFWLAALLGLVLGVLGMLVVSSLALGMQVEPSRALARLVGERLWTKYKAGARPRP